MCSAYLFHMFPAHDDFSCTLEDILIGPALGILIWRVLNRAYYSIYLFFKTLSVHSPFQPTVLLRSTYMLVSLKGCEAFGVQLYPHLTYLVLVIQGSQALMITARF